MDRKIILILFVISSLQAIAQKSLKSEIENIFNLLEENNTPFSGSLMLMKEGEKILTVHKGYANYEYKISFNDSIRFRIASLSKQFTAMLIMQLHEAGKINIKHNLGQYFQEFNRGEASKVTIHQLLTHTSGIEPNPGPYMWSHVVSNYKWDFKNNKAIESFSSQEFLDSISQQPLHFVPGTKYQYNNAAYEILALIIEKTTGMSYEKALESMILKPLLMKNTMVETMDALIPNKAYNYEYANGKTIQPTTRFRNLYPVKASAGIVSTVEDLALWVKAIYFKSDLISKASKEIYFTPNLKNYAFGVMNDKTYKLTNKKEINLIWHTGQISGVQTCILYLPEKEIAAIWLSNIGFSFPTNSFVKRLVSSLYEHFK